jgi:hypothetical protein
MHVLLLVAVTLADAPPANLQHGAQAIATVRVVQATAVSKAAWQAGKIGQRRETHKRDEAGRMILLRLIEHE